VCVCMCDGDVATRLDGAYIALLLLLLLLLLLFGVLVFLF